jgi:hypothetical protein
MIRLDPTSIEQGSRALGETAAALVTIALDVAAAANVVMPADVTALVAGTAAAVRAELDTIATELRLEALNAALRVLVVLKDTAAAAGIAWGGGAAAPTPWVPIGPVAPKPTTISPEMWGIGFGGASVGGASFGGVTSPRFSPVASIGNGILTNTMISQMGTATYNLGRTQGALYKPSSAFRSPIDYVKYNRLDT